MTLVVKAMVIVLEMAIGMDGDDGGAIMDITMLMLSLRPLVNDLLNLFSWLNWFGAQFSSIHF